MNRRIILIIAAMLSLASCSKFVEFKDFFIAFSPGTSDPTSISEAGTITCAYYVHYAGTLPDEASVVTFSVTPGDGLKEGVDYEIVTKGGKLNFLPGIYNLPIRIRFLPHELDPGKDNSLVLRLEECSNDRLTLGYPGPAENNREIKIIKYKE